MSVKKMQPLWEDKILKKMLVEKVLKVLKVVKDLLRLLRRKKNQKKKQGECIDKLNTQITSSLHNFSTHASDSLNFIPTIIHIQENADTYIASGKTIVVAIDELDSLLIEANINGSAGMYLSWLECLFDLAKNWPNNKLKICLLGATLPTDLIIYIKSI